MALSSTEEMKVYYLGLLPHVETTMSTTCGSLQDAENAEGPSPAIPGPPDGGYGWGALPHALLSTALRGVSLR